MNQGHNSGSGSDDRYGNNESDRDDDRDGDSGRDARRASYPSRQRQQEQFSSDWLTHRQQGGSSDWQGRGSSQPGAGSDWQGGSQQPGGARSASSVSSSGYGGYEAQSQRQSQPQGGEYGEGRYGEYGEGRQREDRDAGRRYGFGSDEAAGREGREGRERWGDWHQEERTGRGSQWSSQQGSQRDEWGQGRAQWDQPARGGSRGEGSRQGGWENQRQGGREAWRDSSLPAPDMRTHYRGGYGVSDYEPPEGQSYRTWQRGAAADWLEGQDRREDRSGAGRMRGGQPGRSADDRAYEHFTGASERDSMNRGYGGAGGSAMARRARQVGPKGYQRSDERIREDLCERLALSSRVDVREVEVSVSEGVVTLSGTVQDRQQKYRIEDMADDVFGVKDVHNQIRVTRETAGRPGSSSLSQMAQAGGGLAENSGQGRTSTGAASSSAAGSSGSLGSGLGSGGLGGLGGSSTSGKSDT